jgi:hypothetical protein
MQTPATDTLATPPHSGAAYLQFDNRGAITLGGTLNSRQSCNDRTELGVELGDVVSKQTLLKLQLRHCRIHTEATTPGTRR